MLAHEKYQFASALCLCFKQKMLIILLSHTACVHNTFGVCVRIYSYCIGIRIQFKYFVFKACSVCTSISIYSICFCVHTVVHGLFIWPMANSPIQIDWKHFKEESRDIWLGLWILSFLLILRLPARIVFYCVQTKIYISAAELNQSLSYRWPKIALSLIAPSNICFRSIFAYLLSIKY